MKTILCYGDSNTWGCIPKSDPTLPSERFGWEERWTGVVRQTLGAGYWVIEEGLNGRTTVWDDPIEGLYKNGKSYLLPCLESHRPLDLVVLMLGTNDLKKRFSVPAADIAKSVGALIEVILTSASGPDNGTPQMLLLCPPPVAQLTHFAEMFEGAEAKSHQLAAHYQQVAAAFGCAFLNTAEVIISSDIDGIHFEAAEHRKLGERVATLVKEIVG